MKRGRYEVEAWWIRGGKGEKKIHQWASPMGNDWRIVEVEVLE